MMDLRSLALELAGTVRVDGRVERDLLRGPRELEAWLSGLGIDEPGLELRLADFRELRDAIRSAFSATVEGRPPPPDAVETLNAASGAAPVHRRLEIEVEPPALVDAETGAPSVRVFARIARSAIDLLGGTDRDRLRVCPAPRCGRAFVASRPRQVWCSPACGNRVRVARHHARRAGPRGGTVSSP